MNIISAIEKAGNKLPQPTLLFLWLCLIMIAASWLGAFLELSATHPNTNELYSAKSLLSAEGIRWMLSSTVSNFINFGPVGSVLVAILGIGVAEHSGLLAALLKRLVKRAKGSLLTATIVFAGVMSSMGADAGYVVLIPLAGAAFYSARRNPLAGISAAFAGVSGAFSANLLVGPVDVILANVTNEALKLVDGGEISIAANYYFLIASTILVTTLGTLVCQKWVEPRLEQTEAASAELANSKQRNSESENKGLLAALVYSVIFVLAVTLLFVDGGALSAEANGGKSLFGKTVVPLISLYALGAGIVYGKLSGRYRSTKLSAKSSAKSPADIAANKPIPNDSWIGGMEATMATMAGYLVLMFFAAQFVNYFGWSNLGTIFAINGAEALKAAALPTGLLLALFVLFAATINLFIGSASAKWALLAPIFIPMLYLADIDPATAQMAYRIGDSSTNIITPLMPYFGVVIAFAQKYQKDIGIGSLIAMMLPYSVAFLLGWSAILIGWLTLELPLGF